MVNVEERLAHKLDGQGAAINRVEQDIQSKIENMES
jgi:hypothetical protein